MIDGCTNSAISHSVIVGFTAAAAVLIGVSQVGPHWAFRAVKAVCFTGSGSLSRA
ncbi:hypothetical protein KO498_17770 [Lentibacter algarum]|uniref:hypothetical protein n=1 Tax=Lentibacter algarum TaxID=576131 RepID=UPI001C094E46|nr:hypothetical protein [Lentibacter algarum]MBU2983659.1 hypothetical protein [Lentibacter algarum]